jgi:hypothetical protein
LVYFSTVSSDDANVITGDQAVKLILGQNRPLAEPAAALSEARVRALFEREMGF